jgi:hypothetical protein
MYDGDGVDSFTYLVALVGFALLVGWGWLAMHSPIFGVIGQIAMWSGAIFYVGHWIWQVHKDRDMMDQLDCRLKMGVPLRPDMPGGKDYKRRIPR